MAQLPRPTRAQDPGHGLEVLVRADSAGATHGFVDAIVARGLEFSIGFDVTEPVRDAILAPPKRARVAAIQQDRERREGAGVAEITDRLDLRAWPAGTRVIVRREAPHPGAQFTRFDPQGWRHQAFMTNGDDPDRAYLEARQRGHARVEDRIRTGKDCGLRTFPCLAFAANAVWLLCVQLARTCWRGRGPVVWRDRCDVPSRSGCATRSGMVQDGWCAPDGAGSPAWTTAGGGRGCSRPPSTACRRCPSRPDRAADPLAMTPRVTEVGARPRPSPTGPPPLLARLPEPPARPSDPSARRWSYADIPAVSPGPLRRPFPPPDEIARLG